MKDIKKILEESGAKLTEEVTNTIVAAVGENYKTIADYQKQIKKVETAENERESIRRQLEAANETLGKFGDIDPEKIQGELEKYKQEAANARKEAEKEIAKRDQRDYLKGKFDALEISNDRIRKSLADEIMGEDGLKWKDGEFYGLDDYLSKLNETEHFYKTSEEKEQEEKEKKARDKLPIFTGPSRGKGDDGDTGKGEFPVIW